MRIDEKSQEQPARQSKEDSQAPWRIEAEIDQARQEHLTRCLATVPDITHGVYPFKGMKLNRADIEWLLSEFINGNIATAAGGDEGHPLIPDWICAGQICSMQTYMHFH